MTGIPASTASFTTALKALLSGIDVMIMSGFWAIAASIFATCPCVSPAFETNGIWQSAFMSAQASSIPFLTDSQNALPASECVT